MLSGISYKLFLPSSLFFEICFGKSNSGGMRGFSEIFQISGYSGGRRAVNEAAIKGSCAVGLAGWSNQIFARV